MKPSLLPKRLSIWLRPVSARPRPLSRRKARIQDDWDMDDEKTTPSGTLPYEYDENELKELADLMPPPLEARPSPSSKIEIKRLLEKHGIRCDATFGTDFEERMKEEEAKQKATLTTWTDTRPAFDDLWQEESVVEVDEDEAWREEEVGEAEARLIQMTEFGYECMRDYEFAQIFDKAMELHHSQRQRSRNLYASCMWYAKKLEAAELQDNYEIADPNPIPTFIRAMYTLEEEFDELNSQQYEKEVKMGEHARAIEDAEYREFLKGTVVNMPTKPGSEYHDIFSPPDPPQEEPEPELDIDVYLHGILPNARSDKGLPVVKERPKNAYLDDLIFKEDEMD